MNSRRAIWYLGVLLGGFVGSFLGMQALLYSLAVVFLLEEVLSDG